ncbi:MAG: DUF3078 domain-containing protein [Muribaculaceae bacterium]|nr:DUF3078 domain-containing protein [Muribaculaceae bacterium]
MYRVKLAAVITAIMMYVCDVCAVCVTTDIDSVKNQIPSDTLVSSFYSQYGESMLRSPLVFSGYMSVRRFKPEVPVPVFEMRSSEYSSDSLRYAGILTREHINPEDLEEGDEVLELQASDIGIESSPEVRLSAEELKRMGELPGWFETALRAERLMRTLRYEYMLSHPRQIAYASWEVPAPPTLPDEDYSFISFLESLDLPQVDADAAILPEFEKRRVNWLHLFSTGLHVSQAFVSNNWYQGGTSYLSLLFNFNWDVTLNTVYHPDLMFNSSLSYKLAINSNPKGSLHKYSISQDQFQYNLKAGFKAWQKWFYSALIQFKTQFFNAYPADSPDMTAAFLSPAELNIGLGMTYATTGRNNSLKFAASISPISYNLKACMSNRIDKSQFNIAPGRHTHSEVGSNAELTLDWNITGNISWKSRLFLFTDYSYFLADWENTFNFNINKFLSTQLYVYPRFDSSSDNSTRWHHWMLKEILSLGVTYTFSTKP